MPTSWFRILCTFTRYEIAVEHAEYWIVCLSVSVCGVWRFGMKRRHSHVMWHWRISLEIQFSRQFICRSGRFVSGVGAERRKAIKIHVYDVRIGAMHRFQFPFSSHTSICSDLYEIPIIRPFYFILPFAACVLVWNWFNVKFYSHSRGFRVLCSCIKRTSRMLRAHTSVSSFHFFFPSHRTLLFSKCGCSAIAVCGTFYTKHTQRSVYVHV